MEAEAGQARDSIPVRPASHLWKAAGFTAIVGYYYFFNIIIIKISSLYSKM